ncbi:MAG: sulfotransferase domain-containing protein [Phycisphaerales bacterium]
MAGSKPQIVWLASYPRSGNTWVRTLLHAYAHGEVADTTAVARTIADLHIPEHGGRPTPYADSGKTLIKTHFPWSASHPYAPATAGAIVLVRHPRDVLLSSLNFHRVVGSQVAGKTGAAKTAFDDADYVRTFIAKGGDPGYEHAGYGSWERNLRSWTDALEHPKLIVKYHELRADPTQGLAAMLEFLGEQVDPDRVGRAVAAASFDSMRALEVREKTASGDKNPFFGGSGATLKKGHRFMHQGRVNASLEGIVPGADAKLDAAFARAIEDFGLAVR